MDQHGSGRDHPRISTVPYTSSISHDVQNHSLMFHTEWGYFVILLNNSSYFLLFKHLGGLEVAISSPAPHQPTWKVSCSALLSISTARSEKRTLAPDTTGAASDTWPWQIWQVWRPSSILMVFSWETKRLKHVEITIFLPLKYISTT